MILNLLAELILTLVLHVSDAAYCPSTTEYVLELIDSGNVTSVALLVLPEVLDDEDLPHCTTYL